jgi:hypothetical protein
MNFKLKVSGTLPSIGNTTKKHSFKLSLRLKVALIIVTLVCLGLGLTSFLAYHNSTTALENSIGSNLSNTATQTMDKIDRYLYERMIDVQQLADRKQIQDFLTHPAQANKTTADLSKQLNEFKAQVGVWGDISLMDTHGNVVLTTDEPKLANELARQDDFTSLFKTTITGQTGYSDVILEGSSGSPIMLFMAPIHEQETSGQPIIGVVVGELAWPSTLEILNGLDADAHIVKSNGSSLGDNSPTAQTNVLTKNYANSPAFKQDSGHDSFS